MPELPLVSILIPCFNAEAYLAETIESALRQGEEVPVEIIVWDDGSTDASLTIARRYAERIRIETGPNRGGNVTRNLLLRVARGRWLQYLDADDVLLPGKLSAQLERYGNGSAPPAVIYNPPRCLEMSTGQQRTPPIDTGADAWQHFIRWGVFQTSSLLLDASAVGRVGGWRADQPCCQEHELLLRLLQACEPFQLDPEPRTLYRVHTSGSVSRGDQPRTIRVRMRLTDLAEEHLRNTGQLAAAHRRALAAARLESARSLYASDPAAAQQIAKKVGRLGVLRAAPSDAIPSRYRLAAAILGFPLAERLAATRRIS